MEHQTKGTLRNQAVITSAGSPRATTPRFVKVLDGSNSPNADPIGGFRREPSCRTGYRPTEMGVTPLKNIPGPWEMWPEP